MRCHNFWCPVIAGYWICFGALLLGSRTLAGLGPFDFTFLLLERDITSLSVSSLHISIILAWGVPVAWSWTCWIGSFWLRLLLLEWDIPSLMSRHCIFPSLYLTWGLSVNWKSECWSGSLASFWILISVWSIESFIPRQQFAFFAFLLTFKLIFVFFLLEWEMTSFDVSSLRFSVLSIWLEVCRLHEHQAITALGPSGFVWNWGWKTENTKTNWGLELRV